MTYEMIQAADPSLVLIAGERCLADRVNWDRLINSSPDATARWGASLGCSEALTSPR